MQLLAKLITEIADWNEPFFPYLHYLEFFAALLNSYSFIVLFFVLIMNLNVNCIKNSTTFFASRN